MPTSEPASSSAATSRRPVPEPRTVAVIDIGASAVRLVVAQLSAGQPLQVLEESSRGVALGKDSFSTGRLSAATVDATIVALSGFRRLMDEYRVAEVQAVATSAVREAANADTFLDRVRLRTGLDVAVIDGSEESRLTYLAVRAGLGDHPAMRATSAVLLEVGGGSADITRLAHGQPIQSGIYPLGAIRLRQRLSAWYGSHEQRVKLLAAQVSNVVSDIVREMPLADVHHVIALGSDMRFAAGRIAPEDEGHVREIPREAFLAFCDEIHKSDEETLISRYGLSPVEAETLVPATLVYRSVLLQTEAPALIVPEVSLRAGLLVDLLGVSAVAGAEDFDGQVLAAAAALGARYRYDEPHARAVARLSTRLFDALADDHGLTRRDRLLLEVAALLHDIGLFVSLRGHHRHSLYLLQASEVFGLSREDMQVVGNVARYHRRGLPQKAHVEYTRMNSHERVRINKLAAILRLANALDAEHAQKITNISVHDEDGTWTLTLEGRGDLTMERLAATSRADLLTDVFGKRVVVRQA
jgi:exopolyphosphatase / guanosine-5'-triphosphate,3'-diphosphate pyrophosphatase